MKLYYKAGACSLASHIALKEIGASFDTMAVDLATKKMADGGDFLKVNPKGYIPALALDSGEVLTEGTVVLQYVADLKPAAGLAPPQGTMARYRLQEWLGFINSELHKNFGPLFDPSTPEATRTKALTMLSNRLGFVANTLTQQPFLTGDQFSVADAYLYTVLGWTSRVGVDLKPWPVFADYLARIHSRPAVQAARAAEGI